METTDDKHGIAFNHEEERVWKPAQQCAMNVLENNRKLQGIGAHALGLNVHRLAETSARPGCFAFVPVLRFD